MDPDPSHPSLLIILTTLPATTSAIITLIIALIFLVITAIIITTKDILATISPSDIELITHKERDNILKAQQRYLSLRTATTIFTTLLNVAAILQLCYTFNSIISCSTTSAQIITLTLLITTTLLIIRGVGKQIITKGEQTKNVSRIVPILLFVEQSLRWISVPIGKILHVKPTSQSSDDSDEEEGIDCQKMLEDVISFSEKEAEEIMTARVDVCDIEISKNFKELIEMITDCGYSRIPVYDYSEDNIIGIIYVKDLLPHIGQDIDFDWRTLIRAPYFISGTKTIDTLLKEFQKKKAHMAIVVDQYGGTLGIVTLEDILEEIVGEISDEYDDETPYTQISDTSYIFEGKITIDDFCDALKIDEEIFEEFDEEIDTLAGLLMAIKEDMPLFREVLTYKQYKFTVLELEKRRILKIKVDINNTPNNTPIQDEKSNI